MKMTHRLLLSIFLIMQQILRNKILISRTQTMIKPEPEDASTEFVTEELELQQDENMDTCAETGQGVSSSL